MGINGSTLRRLPGYQGLPLDTFASTPSTQSQSGSSAPNSTSDTGDLAPPAAVGNAVYQPKTPPVGNAQYQPSNQPIGNAVYQPPAADSPATPSLLATPTADPLARLMSPAAAPASPVVPAASASSASNPLGVPDLNASPANKSFPASASPDAKVPPPRPLSGVATATAAPAGNDPSRVPSLTTNDAGPPARPYGIDANGGLQLDSTQPLASTQAAYEDGLIDDDTMRNLLPKAQAAQQAQQEQARISAENPAAWKAFVSGAAKGAGFFAASAPGAAAGAELGSFAGPVGTVVGGALGGLVTGTLGSQAVDATAQALAKHSDTIRSFTDASQLHPYYDSAGNLLAFGAGLPSAARVALAAGAESLAGNATGKTAGILRATAGNYGNSSGLTSTVSNLAQDASIRSAAGASAGQIASALATRVGGQAAANVAIDTAIKEGAKAVGLSDQGQTFDGATQAALIGAFTAGHGIKFQDYSPGQVGSILTKGRAAVAAGNSFDSVLTPKEAEVYNAAVRQIAARVNRGGQSLQNTTISARQATAAGTPYGVTSATIYKLPQFAGF